MYWLCRDADKTFKHMSECSNFAQNEYKIKYVLLGKVIHWELYKKLKFEHTTKSLKHKPERVMENETHNLFWDFEIRTDH